MAVENLITCDQCVTIIQANLQHSKASSALLSADLSKLKNFIALIQEPWIKNKNVCGLSAAGRTVLTDNVSDRPRTCIVISNNLNKITLTNFINQDLVAVSVKLKLNQHEPKDIILASAYFPYEGKNPPTISFKNLVSYSQRQQLPLIVGCDANAHHTSWGSTNTNQRGSDLFEYVVANNLFVANIGNQPTFCTPKREEVIDFTFTNHLANSIIEKWHVDSQDSLSDHKRILFYINNDIKSGKTERRNPKKTDWEEFKFRVEEILIEAINDDWTSKEDLTCSDIDDLSGLLNNSLIKAFEDSCPLKSIPDNKRRSYCPWWNNKLQKLRAKVNRSYNKAKRNVNNISYDQLMAEYRFNRKELKKSIKKSKHDSWKKFCEETQTISSTARLQKILCKDKTGQLGTLKNKDGSFSQTHEEILETLAETHFEGSRPAVSVSVEKYDNCPPFEHKYDMRLIKQIVNDDKIEWAISKFGSYKTAGPDNVFPAMLKEAPTIVIKLLCIIYISILKNSYLPKAWCNVNVIFIPKPGKNSYTDPKAFRPISLSSFFLKTLERLIDNYLRENILIQNPLSEKQHAYMPGRSTETALLQVTKFINKAKEKDTMVLGAFLDIEGAFDNTRCSSIMSSLENYSSPNFINAIIKKMLLERNVVLKFDEHSIKRKVIKGCPQGGVLSPLLWNIVVDELIVTLNKSGFFCQGYADDIVIMVKGRHLGTMCDLLNNAFSKVEKWCVKGGLFVSPEKSKLILFSNKRKPKLPRLPVLFKEPIQLSTEVKYLGIILDPKLNWHKHLNMKINKANNILWQCRRAMAPTWGLGPKQMKWIYTAIVRPTLTYCCILWHAYCDVENNRKTLEKINRTACCLITGCMKSTPTAALEVLLDMDPLSMFVKKMALSSCYRHQNSNFSSKFLCNDLKNQVSNVTNNLANMPSEITLCKRIFVKRFSVCIPSRENSINAHKNLEQCVNCYTDGARNDYGVGAGVVIFHGDKLMEELAIPLDECSTIFQAELVAVIQAAHLMLTYSQKRIKIFSDSQAVLLALDRYEFKSKLVIECVELLNELGKVNVCGLEWVPGHSGIVGNENADLQANKGSVLDFVGPKPAIPLALSVIKLHLNEFIINERNNKWINNEKYRQTKMFFPEVDINKSNQLLNLDRKKLKLMVALITGHCILRKHLSIMGLSDEPTCPKCGQEDDTPLHFFSTCCNYNDIRLSILGNSQLSKSNLKCTNIYILLRFINASRRFDSQC